MPEYVNPEQRGLAAELLKRNVNQDEEMLTEEDSDFLEKVLEDESFDYNPDYDQKLQELTEKYKKN